MNNLSTLAGAKNVYIIYFIYWNFFFRNIFLTNQNILKNNCDQLFILHASTKEVTIELFSFLNSFPSKTFSFTIFCFVCDDFKNQWQLCKASHTCEFVALYEAKPAQHNSFKLFLAPALYISNLC